MEKSKERARKTER